MINFNLLMFAVSNPYLDKINILLTDIKGWILGAIAGITIVVVVGHGVKYQQGSRSEKSDALESIKKTLYMGAGIFMLAWLAGYVVSTFAS